MIAAIYARKSNDQSALHDEAKSVTRQIDHATQYAERKGWRIGDELVFSDDNIGGAEFGTRPGFLRLMNSLKPKPTFQVLVMSEESRLGRESIETAYAIKQLVQAGVRLFFYLEDRERTLDSPTDKLLLSVATFADELEREKARQRTYDAMLRKAKVGHVTGGRVFGYINVDVMRPGPDGEPRRSHVERHINPKEADIIRQIFQLCADGCGKTRIAKLLNVEGVIAPRAQQGRPRAWSPSTVHEALYRPLYRGQVIWNQTRKRDKWGRKRMQQRPESEWLVVSAPQLQIVPDELWDAAHARLTYARSKYLRSTDGRLWGRPQDRESKYLLSGFARCGECGGSVSVRTHAHGKRRAPYYACLAYHQRGACVCRNRVEMPMAAVDDAVLDSLAEDILQPDIVEAAINRAIERLAPGARAEEAARIRKELTEVQRIIDNLTTAVGASGGLPSLLASLKAEEQRKVDLEAQLSTAEHLAAVVDVNAIRAKLETRLADWRTLLRQQVSQTRQILRKLLDGPVTLTLLPDGQGVRLEGHATYGKVLEGVISGPRKVASPAGFEPASPP